jgi:hypothetical protein
MCKSKSNHTVIVIDAKSTKFFTLKFILDNKPKVVIIFSNDIHDAYSFYFNLCGEFDGVILTSINEKNVTGRK